MIARPIVEPFASEADREAWRAHVERGWWRRIVHARSSAVVAQAIKPYLLINDPENAGIAPWTRDLLVLLWSNSLDRVVLTCVELLHPRTDVHSFAGLKRDLERWCAPAAWPVWRDYLDEVIRDARRPAHLQTIDPEPDPIYATIVYDELPPEVREPFRKAKLARDNLVAHSSRDPLKNAGPFVDVRMTLGEVLELQDSVEQVFHRFPSGGSWGIRSATSRNYPELIARIVKGDFAPVGNMNR